MSRLISSKRTLYDIDGNVLCYGSTKFGGKLKTTGNNYACQLLELAFRPTYNVTQKYNRRKTQLHEYYKELLDKEIPQSLKEYKNKLATLILTDGIGFIHVYGKSDTIILLPDNLFSTVKRIINNSRRKYNKKLTNARNKMNKVTQPLSVGTRMGASVLQP